MKLPLTLCYLASAMAMPNPSADLGIEKLAAQSPRAVGGPYDYYNAMTNSVSLDLRNKEP